MKNIIIVMSMFLLCLISCDKDEDKQEEDTEVEFVQEVVEVVEEVEEEIKEDWEPLENDEQIISMLVEKELYLQKRIKNYNDNEGEYIESERNYPRNGECSVSYDFDGFYNSNNYTNWCWVRSFCSGYFSETPFRWRVENNRLRFDYDDDNHLSEYIVKKNSDDKIKFTLSYIAPSSHYHDNYTNLVLEEIFYIE